MNVGDAVLSVPQNYTKVGFIFTGRRGLRPHQRKPKEKIYAKSRKCGDL